MKPNLSGFSPYAPVILELAELREHFHHCKQSGGRFFVVRCAAEALKSFMSTRLITCAVVLGVLIGISSMAV
jgi:hypothetical protein